jgi:S1-C subfamily serine protease
MRKLSLLLGMFFVSIICNAQSVYIYSNNISGLVGKIRVYNDKGDKVAELQKNQWIEVTFTSKANENFTIKCANYFSNKKVNVNLEDKDVVFIRVQLSQSGWRVIEQVYPDVPANVWNDYVLKKNKRLLKNRIANHPTTEWTEAKLKEQFTDKSDAIEGIYENSFSSENSPRYKVGILKEDGAYKVVYLSGGDSDIWKEGDIKANLTETATQYLYKTMWYMGNKSQNDEVYITFSKGMFTTILSDGEESQYVKLFPVSSSINNPNATSSGTGFALHKGGYIVTNYHVIEGGNQINVKGVNGDFNTSYTARVIIEDKNNDLAILKISDSAFSFIRDIPYKLNLKVVDVGSSVFVLGYPLRSTMGDEVKLTNGIISSKSGFQGDITTYQVSAPVQPGNSGGALFDNNGNVVGIINAKHLDTENVSYAIKTLYLYNLIQSIESPPSELNTNTIKDKTLTEQVKAVKNFIYIIEVQY